jgi:hypothetical protein
MIQAVVRNEVALNGMPHQKFRYYANKLEVKRITELDNNANAVVSEIQFCRWHWIFNGMVVKPAAANAVISSPPAARLNPVPLRV